MTCLLPTLPQVRGPSVFHRSSKAAEARLGYGSGKLSGDAGTGAVVHAWAASAGGVGIALVVLDMPSRTSRPTLLASFLEQRNN